MIEPRISDQAEADLDEIWAYIATNNQDAADRMVDTILAGSRLHVRFPSMGQNRRELGPSLRSFVVSPYVVFSRPQADTIEKLRVSHAARDFDRLIDPDQ